jgi:hypothetical protein
MQEMGKGLAFARAIGLKWSSASIDQEPVEERGADALIENALAGDIVEAAPTDDAAADLTPALPDGLPAPVGETASSGAIATIATVRESVTNEAINAIEADIASLLANMNAVSDAAPEEMSPATPVDDDDVDAEDATLALLGELDRMWRADPMIASSGAA